jgi:predicted  nucleic acid-binding Zn-ribbon protein
MAIKEAEEMKKKVFNLEKSLKLKNEEMTTLKKQFEEDRMKLKKPYEDLKFEIKKTLEEKQKLNSKTNFKIVRMV